MTIARHAGAWLIVGTLVYALCVISPAWPAVVVGIVGGFLFAVAELDELAGWWRARSHDRKTQARIDGALLFAQKAKTESRG
ncbi:MAG: hypothetical protein ABSD62_15355 [Candidatus Limnocylindrales bacterium]